MVINVPVSRLFGLGLARWRTADSRDSSSWSAEPQMSLGCSWTFSGVGVVSTTFRDVTSLSSLPRRTRLSLFKGLRAKVWGRWSRIFDSMETKGGCRALQETASA